MSVGINVDSLKVTPFLRKVKYEEKRKKAEKKHEKKTQRGDKRKMRGITSR